jgi:hypothetical protein
MPNSTFAAMQFRDLGTYMRVDGPPQILDVLKEHFRSRGISCKLKVDRFDGTVLLKVRPGPSPDRVSGLLDEWTQ